VRVNGHEKNLTLFNDKSWLISGKKYIFLHIGWVTNGKAEFLWVDGLMGE